MNDEESCMDEEPSALSEFVTNIKSPNRQQEEQPRTSEMVSTEYDTTSITIESIITTRNEEDDDVVEVLERSHTPEMVLQPNLISPVLELGVVQPNWAVETVVVVVNETVEEKNEENEENEEEDVEPIVSQVLGNVIEIIEAETETEQQNHDDDGDNDEVVEIQATLNVETTSVEATATAEVEAAIVEVETAPVAETTSTAEATATTEVETNSADEVGADVVEIETTPNVETTSTAEATTPAEANVIESATTTAEIEANFIEIETTSAAEQTEQIEQMSEEEEERPPKSGNPVQQPLVVIVAPAASETTTAHNHSTSNKESLADASSERNIDVLSPPKSAETMMSSGTSSSRAAESSNDQTSIASPLSNTKRPENTEKTKSIKTSEKLMLRYRNIRRVRDVRETEIVLVCDVVSARDGRLIDSKQLADMKFTHELNSTSRCKVVCERRVSQAELDNELKQMKEEFEENEENFTDNDESENNSDNRSQRVNEKTTMSVSTSPQPQETTNRHEKSKSRGEKRISSTNPNAIANPIGRPRTKSHQERSNRRLAHQDMNDTNSNTSTATTPQQQQSARSLRKRKVPFSPSANSSLLGIDEDEDTTANNEEKSVKRRTKTTRLASPSRHQQPSTPTRTDKTPVKETVTATTTKTPTVAQTTTLTTSTKKATDPPLFASLCFDLAPKKSAIVESPLLKEPSPNLMDTNAIEENFDLMPVEASNSEERLATAVTNGISSSIQIRFGRNSKSLTKKAAVETNTKSLVVNEKKKVVRENNLNDDEYICISDSSSENIGPVESPQKSSTITKSPSKSASKSPSMTNGKENNSNNNNDNNSSVPGITDPKDKRECRIVLKRLSLDEIARLMRTTPTATPTTPNNKKRQREAIEIDLSTPSPKSSPDGYSVGELVWARGRGGHFYPAKVRHVELTPASRTRLFTVVYLKPSTKRQVQMAEPNNRTLGDYLTAADLVRFDDLKCSQLLLFYRDDDASSSGDNESDEEVKKRLYPGFLVAYDSAASPRSVSHYLIVDGLLTDRSQREAAYDFDDDPVLTRLRIPLQSIVVPRKDLLNRPLTTDALIDVKLLKNIESIKNLDDKPVVVNASNTKTSSDSQKKSKMSLKAILSATQPTTSAKPTKTARKRTQTRENPKKRQKSRSKTRTASNSRVKDSHQEKVNRIELIDNEDDNDDADDDEEQEEDVPLALLDESIEDYESPDIIPDDIEYDLVSNYNNNEMTVSSNSMATGKTSTTTTMLASSSSRSSHHGFIVCESSISDENAAKIVDPNLISSSRFVGNQRKNSKQAITRRKEAAVDRSSSTRSRLRVGRNGSTG